MEKEIIRTEWVPGYEGNLQYNVDDFINDKIVRFYRVIKRPGRIYRYEIIAIPKKFRDTDYRSLIHIHINNKSVYLKRSRLTFTITHGFPPANGLVVDHKNRISNDDRPSNLHAVTHKENTENSIVSLMGTLPHKIRKVVKAKRAKFYQDRISLLQRLRPNTDIDQILIEAGKELQEYEVEIFKEMTEKYGNKRNCRL